MGEFRIGRSHAQHAYPDTRGGSALLLLARNFASGPEAAQAIPEAGAAVVWNAIDAGQAPPSADVPITPRSTGKIIVRGVIVAANASGSDWDVFVELVVDGVVQSPPAVVTTVPAGGNASIPFLAEYTLVPGVSIPIGLNVTALVRAEYTWGF